MVARGVPFVANISAMAQFAQLERRVPLAPSAGRMVEIQLYEQGGLLNFSNAEDPRGIVRGAALWLFYTTTIQIYHDGKVKPQELGRMELRRFDWPGLRRQTQWCNFAWEGNVGVQKNWVPLELSNSHVLFSHSLDPHTVLRCALPARGAGGGRDPLLVSEENRFRQVFTVKLLYAIRAQ